MVVDRDKVVIGNHYLVTEKYNVKKFMSSSHRIADE